MKFIVSVDTAALSDAAEYNSFQKETCCARRH